MCPWTKGLDAKSKGWYSYYGRNSSACHIYKYIWQCDEDQTWTGTDFHAIAEACREDDQSCHDCNKCIESTDTDALPGKRIVFAHVASEDLHCRNTQTQSEERLVHSRRVGSITIDEALMEAAGIFEYEKVQIVDIENGNRFETADQFEK